MAKNCAYCEAGIADNHRHDLCCQRPWPELVDDEGNKRNNYSDQQHIAKHSLCLVI